MQKMVGIKQMVHVYAADITGLPDPLEHPQLMEELSEERKQKIMRHKQLGGRKQSLGAGLLLGQVLFRHGVIEGEICISEYGKPEIADICFNLSHSHEMVVCAVSAKSVGCDVEKVVPAPEKVAERFFTKKETEYINRDEDFFRLWTMKESYMKMTGEGIHLPLNQFEIRLEEQLKVYREGERCVCFIKEYEIPGYKLSVCAEEAEFASEIQYISLAKNGDS